MSSTTDFVCSVCTQVHGPQDYRMQLTGVWIAATIMIIHELRYYSQLTFTADVAHYVAHNHMIQKWVCLDCIYLLLDSCLLLHSSKLIGGPLVCYSMQDSQRV